MTLQEKVFPFFTEIPAHTGLDAWLTCPDSLTERLYARAGCARLELLSQALVPASSWDRECLGIEEETVFRREIRMWDAASPCWYAMAVIPASVWAAHALFFDRLRHEPMGKLLFAHNEVHRTEFKRLGVLLDSEGYAHMSGVTATSFCIRPARLSAFSLREGEGFHLLEVLLPGLENYTT